MRHSETVYETGGGSLGAKNTVGFHSLSHRVKRDASRLLERDEGALEVAEFIKNNPTGPSQPTPGTAEHDEQWWMRGDLTKGLRLARPVQSLVRLCLEPILWRAPSELGVLTLTSSERTGPGFVVDVTTEAADAWHRDLGECLEAQGQRILSSSPVSYRVRIDLEGLHETRLDGARRDIVQ